MTHKHVSREQLEAHIRVLFREDPELAAKVIVSSLISLEVDHQYSDWQEYGVGDFKPDPATNHVVMSKLRWKERKLR